MDDRFISLEVSGPEFLVNRAEYEALESFLSDNFGSYEIGDVSRESSDSADQNACDSECCCCYCSSGDYVDFNLPDQDDGDVSICVDNNRNIVGVTVSCSKEVDLTYLAKLSQLNYLRCYCKVINLDSLLGTNLENFNVLEVNGINQSQFDAITKFPNLLDLDILDVCEVDLQDIVKLKTLKKLDIHTSFDSRTDKILIKNADAVFSLSNLILLHLVGKIEVDLSLIDKLQNLRWLYYYDKILDQKQFDAVCKLQNLRGLQAIYYFDGLDLSNISNLLCLEELTIKVRDCGFKKSDFEAIGKIKTLKTLDISNGSGVPFSNIYELGDILQKLSEDPSLIGAHKDTDPMNNPNLGLANIKVLEYLEKLSVYECYIDQEALDSFLGLKHLRDLYVYSINGLDWSKITQSGSLNILTIDCAVLTQKDLDDIFSSHVTELSLQDVNKPDFIDWFSLESIDELKYDKIINSKITNLHIVESPLSQEGLETICKCNQITSLELMSIPDKLDYSCITNLTNLKFLSISDCELDEKDINLLKSLNCETEIYE